VDRRFVASQITAKKSELFMGDKEVKKCKTKANENTRF
jgi:hypothetical protein